jgi:ERCC4-type nuclease
MGELITPDKIQPGILYIDSREPPQFALLFKDIGSIPVQVAMLETGDYVYEDICFERKTIYDFVGSITGKKDKKGRLFAQSDRMVDKYENKFIFVTQTLEQYDGRVHEHCILGALARMLSKGITVCFGIVCEEQFVYLVLKTLEKIKFKPPEKEANKNGNHV